MYLDVCRLCSKDDQNLVNVFNNPGEEDLTNKIHLCFGVKICEDDAITKKICKSCYFFTNSVYEHRISAVENDAKLRKKYEAAQASVSVQQVSRNVPQIHKSLPRKPVFQSSKTLSQNDFLNSLKLIKTLSENQFTYHPSIIKIKRAYPEVNIPSKCHSLHLDPIVDLNETINKGSTQNLGTWSVIRKRRPGRPPGVTLSRMKVDSKKRKIQTSPIATSSIHSSSTTKSGVSSTIGKPRGPGRLKLANKNILKSQITKIAERPVIESPSSSKPNRKRKVSTCAVTNETPRAVNSLNCNLNDFNISTERKYSRKKVEKKKRLSSLKNKNNEKTTSVNITSNDLAKLTNEVNDKTENVNVEVEDNNLLISDGNEMTTFICQTCNKVFDTLAILEDHQKNNHKKPSLQCSNCSKKFSVVEKLMEHNLSVHTQKDNEQKRTELKIILDGISVSSTSKCSNNGETVINRSINISTEQKRILTVQDLDNEIKLSASKPILLRKAVAKKSTGQVNRPKMAEFSRIESLSDENLETVKNNEISKVHNAEKTEDQKEIDVFRRALNVALQAQTKSMNKMSSSSDTSPNNVTNSSSLLLAAALKPQLLSGSAENQTQPEIAMCAASALDLYNNVYVVEDSDDGEDDVLFVPEEEEDILLDLPDKPTSLETKQGPLPVSSNDATITSIPSDNKVPADTRRTSGTKRIELFGKDVLTDCFSDVQNNEVTITNSDSNHKAIIAKVVNDETYINYVFNKCKKRLVGNNNDKRILQGFRKLTKNFYIPIKLTPSKNDAVATEYYFTQAPLKSQIFDWSSCASFAIQKCKKVSNSVAVNEIEEISRLQFNFMDTVASTDVNVCPAYTTTSSHGTGGLEINTENLSDTMLSNSKEPCLVLKSVIKKQPAYNNKVDEEKRRNSTGITTNPIQSIISPPLTPVGIVAPSNSPSGQTKEDRCYKDKLISPFLKSSSCSPQRSGVIVSSSSNNIVPSSPISAVPLSSHSVIQAPHKSLSNSVPLEHASSQSAIHMPCATINNILSSMLPNTMDLSSHSSDSLSSTVANINLTSKADYSYHPQRRDELASGLVVNSRLESFNTTKQWAFARTFVPPVAHLNNQQRSVGNGIFHPGVRDIPVPSTNYLQQYPVWNKSANTNSRVEQHARSGTSCPDINDSLQIDKYRQIVSPPVYYNNNNNTVTEIKQNANHQTVHPQGAAPTHVSITNHVSIHAPNFNNVNNIPVNNTPTQLASSITNQMQPDSQGEVVSSCNDSSKVQNYPSIRIKQLSELTDKGILSSDERNILHNNYFKTLTNYVNSYSNSPVDNSTKPNDEYFRIS